MVEKAEESRAVPGREMFVGAPLTTVEMEPEPVLAEIVVDPVAVESGTGRGS